jgi:hypothetical protein
MICSIVCSNDPSTRSHIDILGFAKVEGQYHPLLVYTLVFDTKEQYFDGVIIFPPICSLDLI